MSAKNLIALSISLLLLAPGLVWGQQLTPSDGIPVPDSSVATQSDAASLEVNPAGLGYLHGMEASYGFFAPTSEYELVVPTGHALSLGAGGSLGGLGISAQWVEDRRLGAPRFPYQKYSLGAALSPVRHLSVGGNLNYFSSRRDQSLNDLRTLDLGVQFRPASFLGLGLMARDVAPAFLDDDRALPLNIGVGLALRAFDGRLVVDNEAHYIDGDSRFEYRPRLSFEALSGLRAFGHAIVDVPLPGRSGFAEFRGFNAGLELSFGELGFQGSGYFGHFGASDAQAITGVAGRLWTGTERKRSLTGQRDTWVALDLDDSLAEQAVASVFAPPTQSFLDLINDLDAIAEDPTVPGVILKVGQFNLGLAQLWELHDAMDRLRESGKESLALIQAEAPSTRTFYAAAAADEIWMAPHTPYGPTGLGVDMVSYAGMLDRFGIEAEFMRIGDYKSAPESFVESAPSAPALAQTNRYLDAIYEELTSRIASRRGMSTAAFQEIVDATPILPADALDRGLIDEIMYLDEMDEALRTDLQAPVTDDYQRIQLAHERWGARPEIAVVYVDGIIASGVSGASPLGGDMITGAETLRQILESLRTDRNVRAVVLRVDSPGGSALASDVIYRAIRRVAQQKPVIASMGNVAASGGYYVAAAADEIFATPITLTGSIGIYTGKFNLSTLAQRLGLGVHFEARGERSGVFSVWRPWNDSERQAVAKTLDYLYELFIEQVARNRDLTPDEVDQVARGRVWTGADAQEQGLVDHLGGISDALRRAEHLAGLSTGEAVYTDRSGAAGALLSPGMATHLGHLLTRLGIHQTAPMSLPQGQLKQAAEDVESGLVWPLYFESSEAIFMLPYAVTYQ